VPQCEVLFAFFRATQAAGFQKQNEQEHAFTIRSTVVVFVVVAYRLLDGLGRREPRWPPQMPRPRA
jgi:hypothetical protein